MIAQCQSERNLGKLLTIVTISYERKVFLKRYLQACEQNGFDTIIVDGSQAFFDGHIPANVSYFHFPDDGPLQRLSKGFDKVTTPYTLLLADDDFILPSTLLKALKFLEENPAYLSVQGRVLTFNELFSQSDVQVNSYKGFDKATPLDTSQADIRLTRHMSDYVFTIYSLQRTFVWKRCLESVYSNLKDHPLMDCNCPAIFELMQSIHCVLSGKNKNLDDIFLIRESIPRPKSEKVEGHLYFNETIEFEQYLKRFVPSLVETLCLKDDIDWYALIKKSFADFSEFRRRNVSSSIFNLRGSLHTFEVEDQNQQVEFDSIANLITTYRMDVLNMLFNSGLQHVKYWFDEHWRRDIASQFIKLTQVYSDYVVYGVGEHTKQLFNNNGFGKGIKAMSDSNSAVWGKAFFGECCIEPAEILNYSHNVIISSQNFENEIAVFLEKLHGSKINILRLYDR
jgi:glycosyltransferase domain-containing protein